MDPTPPPPPIPPSHETLNNSAKNRRILQPFSTLKRAAPTVVDLYPTSVTIDENQFHSYLPQELTKIFIERQRQEKAWQTRLLVCTSFISCIDSAVASFHDDDEKEMAKSIQAHLRTAVFEFGASNVTPAISKQQPTNIITKVPGNSKINTPQKPTVFTLPFKIPKGQVGNVINSTQILVPKTHQGQKTPG